MNVEVIRKVSLIVRVCGEIDISNVHELQDALDEAVRVSPKGFVIDLSEVTYLDSVAMGVIISSYQRLAEVHGRISLVLENGGPRSLVELLHLEKLPDLCICRDISSAQEAICTVGREQEQES